MKEVVLNGPEIGLVTYVAEQRIGLAREKERRRLEGLPGQDSGTLHDDLVGAAAEYVVAKLTGKFWHALAEDIRKDVLKADVGEDIHVKAVTEAHHNLIVKKNDPRFGVYAVCYVDLPRVVALGAFPAVEILEGDWNEGLPAPAYLIGRSRLVTLPEAYARLRRESA